MKPPQISTPALLLATAAAIVLMVALNLGVGGTVDPVPDLLHPATPTTLRAAFDALDPAERVHYVRWAWLDVLYPLAYSTALSGALARLAPERWRRVAWLPFAAAAADLVENAAFVAFAASWWDLSDAALLFACVANGVKWLAADLSFLALALAGLARLVRRFASPRPA